MKIYINKINEDWIVDRFKTEWEKSHKNLVANNIIESDIVWIISPWTFKSLPTRNLRMKKILCTVHHLDLENFSSSDYKQFLNVDKYVDYYHVLSSKTEEKLRKLSNKEIFVQPFWADSKLWYKKENRSEIKKNLGFNESDFLIGSFQRDTEGKDLTSPKLIKGPDIFVELLEKHFDKNNIKIVLTGKRRQFIIKKLNEKGIKYKYFEMVNNNDLNDLYNILDLYIVSSRLEGGPQQILECALSKTPIVSTDVGIAKYILSEESIYDVEKFEKSRPNITKAYENAQNYKIPNGFIYFEKLFDEIYQR